jgi:hypothetical protein
MPDIDHVTEIAGDNNFDFYTLNLGLTLRPGAGIQVPDTETVRGIADEYGACCSELRRVCTFATRLSPARFARSMVFA